MALIPGSGHRALAKVGLVLVPLVLVAAACSGSDKKEETKATTAPSTAATQASGSGSSTQPSATATRAAGTQAAATATRAASTGGTLKDCEYAAAVQKSVEKFQKNIEDQVGKLTSTSPSNPAQAKDQILKLVDALDSELGNLSKDLKSLNVSGDLKQVNDDLVLGVEDTRKKLPDARKAANDGDFNKVVSVLTTIGEDVGTRFDKIEQKYPDVNKRLSACPS